MYLAFSYPRFEDRLYCVTLLHSTLFVRNSLSRFISIQTVMYFRIIFGLILFLFADICQVLRGYSPFTDL